MIDEYGKSRVYSTLFGVNPIPHYYGNFIRTAFISVAVISAVVIPLWGDIIPFGIVFQVIGILTLVLLAGFTTPHNTGVMLCNVVASGVALFMFEIFAIKLFSDQAIIVFLARELAAIVMLVAFYLSIKTIRAMSTGQIGKAPPVHEFDTPEAE